MRVEVCCVEEAVWIVHVAEADLIVRHNASGF